jgi:hypothetical protein
VPLKFISRNINSLSVARFAISTEPEKTSLPVESSSS